MESAAVLALIAIVGSVITAQFKVINSGAKATEKQAKATEDLVKETRKGNKEAKDRNGHLGELIIQSMESTKTVTKGATQTIIDAVGHVNTQHISNQTVDHQEIKK